MRAGIIISDDTVDHVTTTPSPSRSIIRLVLAACIRSHTLRGILAVPMPYFIVTIKSAVNITKIVILRILYILPNMLPNETDKLVYGRT